MTDLQLTRRDPVGEPRGVVLMLHGGAERGVDGVSAWSRAWGRSAWMQRAIAPGLVRDGYAVWLLRFRMRGWNGHRAVPSPVPDAREALDVVRATHGDAPVVLLGHSMGARTALHVCDDPSVIAMVGLAPWLPAADPVGPLADRDIAVAHGSGDRITLARETKAFLARAGAVARSATFHDMGPVGHYLMRDRPGWDHFASYASRGMFEAREH